MRGIRWFCFMLILILPLLSLPSAGASAASPGDAVPPELVEWPESPPERMTPPETPQERMAQSETTPELIALPDASPTLMAWLETPPSPQPRLRALLIGCDHFVSLEDTWPAADNNLRMLSDTLMTDQRRYALIRSYSSSIATVEAFEEAVRSAFENARDEDVSLLYISTHGVNDDSGGEIRAGVLLSDGEQEALLEAAALQEILNTIPGKKVLILDACNSGALIGKGLHASPDQACFTGTDYKVLCSAGGSEASWYYQSAQNAASDGASYFATVLAYGLGNQGDFAADRNQDGLITLEETYAFLYENYAASTPQVYPQRDDFILFAYDVNRPWAVTQAITDITFEDTLLTAGQSEVTFSFTVQRQVELYYQIVYHRDGGWQFGQAQHYLDGEQLDGTVRPGRKERTLSLDTGALDAYGYAMSQMITREGEQTVFQGARLLCVQPAEGEVQLSVTTGTAFVPRLGEEMPIFVQHDVPCGLTVNVVDADGKVVRRLAYDAPTRPQQIIPNASTFYWDGLLTSGDTAPAGTYAVVVRVRLGDQTFTARSEAFELLEEPTETRVDPIHPNEER